MTHGDFALAVRLHPLAPVAVPAVALAVIAKIASEIAQGSSENVPSDRAVDRALGALAVIGLIV